MVLSEWTSSLARRSAHSAKFAWNITLNAMDRVTAVSYCFGLLSLFLLLNVDGRSIFNPGECAKHFIWIRMPNACNCWLNALSISTALSNFNILRDNKHITHCVFALVHPGNPAFSLKEDRDSQSKILALLLHKSLAPVEKDDPLGETYKQMPVITCTGTFLLWLTGSPFCRCRAG